MTQQLEVRIGEGERCTIRIACNGVEASRIARLVRKRALRRPGDQVGFAIPSISEVVISPRVGLLQLEIVETGVDAWKCGEVDLVALRCEMCASRRIAIPMFGGDPSLIERAARLLIEKPFLATLVSGFLLQSGTEWRAECIVCQGGTR